MPKAIVGALGKFEEAVLNAVFHLGDDAYGVAIRQRVTDLNDKPAAVGAIYTTLSRLEKKRLVESRFSAPTQKRGGRRKRIYTLTKTGLEAMFAATLRVKRLYPGLVS